MYTQQKFHKRANTDFGIQASAHACFYSTVGHIGINLVCFDGNELNMKLNAEEAEILAAQLLESAKQMRARFSAGIKSPSKTATFVQAAIGTMHD